jgi:hypothetical protein
MPTAKDREDDLRKERLADMKQQIEDGTLKIRKMTAKERAAYLPRPRREGGPRRKRYR